MRILANTFIEFFHSRDVYLYQMPKNAFPPIYVARHSIEEFCLKSNSYALVLNVRNEGERLANQLERLRQYRSCVDIVVSDAPSSDGSTHSVRLKKAGVTTLISLLEPGRYSASALAAFAHCRNRGYRGVILMDGNDKDDPEAIPRFVMRLDEDFDFIQGSRYIDGGKAIRMPATRDFLIRMVHAPIFSFLCGWSVLHESALSPARAYQCSCRYTEAVDFLRKTDKRRGDLESPLPALYRCGLANSSYPVNNPPPPAIALAQTSECILAKSRKAVWHHLRHGGD